MKGAILEVLLVSAEGINYNNIISNTFANLIVISLVLSGRFRG